MASTTTSLQGRSDEQRSWDLHLARSPERPHRHPRPRATVVRGTAVTKYEGPPIISRRPRNAPSWLYRSEKQDQQHDDED
jgi:hypothetical protein